MTTVQLVHELEARGVRLWLEGTDLRYDAPKGVMTAELLSALRSRKESLAKLLAPAATPWGASPGDRARKRFDIAGLRPRHSPLVPAGWTHEHPFFRYVEPHKAFLLDRLGLDKRYVRGDGGWLFDEHGDRYFDCVAQYGALPFGHNPIAMWDAVRAAADRMEPAFAGNSMMDAAGELAERLVSLWPEAGFAQVVFTNSGAEAIEAAIKLCRAATGRRALLTTRGAFHGLTLGALSVAGSDSYRQGFGVTTDDVDHVPYGDEAALREALRTRPDRYAALLLEPIQGEAGINDPPAGYLRAAREACDASGTLLILDEVQTGLGRTGDLFACQHEGVVPDVLPLAKALGGGLVPIGACLYRATARTERFGLRHSSTFAGGTLACRVGLATLDLLTADQGALLRKVREDGTFLRNQLLDVKRRHPTLVADITGRGLMLGVKLTFTELWRVPGLVGYLSDQNLAIHLIVSYLLNVHRLRISPSFSSGDVLRVQPPLTSTREQLESVAAAIDETLACLASGNSLRLIGHLLGEDASETTTATPTIRVEEPRRPAPTPPHPSVGRFAFTVHLLSAGDLRRIDPALDPLDTLQLELLKEQLEEYMDPFPIETLDVRGANGARAYGELILVPYTPTELLQMAPAKALEEVELAVRVAHERGAEVVGLGGFTSVVTQGGLALDGRGLPPLTSGNSFTATAAKRALVAACADRGRRLEDTSLAIIGAAGMIGRAVAALVAGRVDRLILVGNPARPDRSRARLREVALVVARQVAADLEHGGVATGALAHLIAASPRVDEELLDRLERAGTLVTDCELQSALRQADAVITATSSTRTLIQADHVRPGAIICDVARPFNVDPEIRRRRPDVCLIEGGLVILPPGTDSGIHAGPRPGVVYACVAETMLWALERAYDQVSPAGCMEIAAIRRLEAIGDRHGFVVDATPA